MDIGNSNWLAKKANFHYIHELSNLSKYEESLEWFHHGIFIKRCSLSMHFSRQGPINLWILHRRKQAAKAKLSWLGSTLWREKSQTLFQIDQNVEGNQPWSNFFQPGIRRSKRRHLNHIPFLFVNKNILSTCAVLRISMISTTNDCWSC